EGFQAPNFRIQLRLKVRITWALCGESDCDVQRIPFDTRVRPSDDGVTPKQAAPDPIAPSDHADYFDCPPETGYASPTRFPTRLILGGETHGFETIWSKRISERQRRVGRRFVGSSDTGDRPNTGIPTNDQGRQGSDCLRHPLAFRQLGTHSPRRQAFAR